MIIKIDSQERQQLEKICAVFDLTCRIYTMENNSNLIQAQVLHPNGDDLSADTAWYLCASVQTKIAMTRV